MSEEKNIEIIVSGDGSHTLVRRDMDETYHSTKGAITESKYVFLKEGLHHFADQKEVSILEVGFGTGLNAFLTYLDAKTSGQQIFYQTLEPIALGKDIYEHLNYPAECDAEEERDIFLKLHECDWHEKIQITENFSISKVRSPLENYVAARSQFDVVYFDAFAPSRQPEVWSRRNLKKVYAVLKKGGILTTYCSQGEFRRDLEKVGFDVAKIPGPPGKREMIKGVK